MKKYFLRNLTNNEIRLLDKDDTNIENGLFGYMHISFDDSNEFFGTFTAVIADDTTDGRNELAEFIGFLRTAPVCPVFRSLEDMSDYCDNLRMSQEFTPVVNSADVCISGGSDKFQFYVRCSPDEKSAIIYCYSKDVLIEKEFVIKGGI